MVESYRNCGFRDSCMDDDDTIQYRYHCISDYDDPCGSSEIRPRSSMEYTCCCSTDNCNTAEFALKCASCMVNGSFIIVYTLVTIALFYVFYY